MAAALLVRREALEEVGIFDEDFFIYSEETDLCRRLRNAGWRTQFFPLVTVVHHESQFSAGIPERRINEMWRGRHRYWRKHHTAAGARVAALLTGAQYALRGLIRARDRDFAARMRLHTRNAIRVTGPGLRELADDWNRAHAAAALSAPIRQNLSSRPTRFRGNAVPTVKRRRSQVAAAFAPRGRRRPQQVGAATGAPHPPPSRPGGGAGGARRTEASPLVSSSRTRARSARSAASTSRPTG